jgi:hypothetical protein
VTTLHGVHARLRYRRAVRLAPLLVTAVLAAACTAVGCTTTVAGTPSAQPGVQLPPRPREVRLDGVDPCTLLTAEQRAALGLTSQPRPSRPFVTLFRGDVPTCTMRGGSPENVLLVSGAVTTAGVERWHEPDISADVRPTTIADFPGLVATPRQFTDYCHVEVDVATGQLLDVQLGGGAADAVIPQAELCARARRAAEQMMATLLAR